MKQLLLCLFLLSSSLFATEITNLRDSRYCEVLIGNGSIFKKINMDVYNSIGLNDCPDEIWASLSANKIKKEIKSRFVKLNGPRFWVMDSMEASLINTDIVNFDGIEMRKAGIVAITFKDVFGKRHFYKERHVNRNSVWKFDKNQYIFELISQKNKVYVMQSYTTEVLPLTIKDLVALSEKLKLPKGWKYQARLLKEPLAIPIPNHQATVIQDDLHNSYTLVE
jgi:hypothetical protein